LVDQAPRPLREYVESLERVAGDDFRVDRIGGSHSTDPETSSKAALANFPRSGTQRCRVLEALAARRLGATFEELVADTGIKSAAKRLTELKAGGWAIATGTSRTTSMGSTAEVHLASKRALQELERDRRADQTAGGGASSLAEHRAVLDQGTPSARVEAPPADHDPAVRGGDPDVGPKPDSSTARESRVGADTVPAADPVPFVGFDAAIEVGGTAHRKGPYDDVFEDAA